MDEFDKEFENAPDANFDDEFEAAPEAGLLEQASQFGQQLYQDVGAPIVEPIVDFGKGVAAGATMNALDELGGLAGAAIESGLGKLGIGPAAVDAQLAAQGFKGAEESFLDKYRGYQQGIEQSLKEGEERSPVLSTLGQISGGVTSGIALGGLLGAGKAGQGLKSISDIARDSGKSKAALELLKRGGTNYAKAAPLIAAESALTSEAQLLGEGAQPKKVAADVAGGLAFGLPAVLGLQAASDVIAPRASGALKKIDDKLTELVEDKPLLRQMKIAYQKYGKEYKVNPKSEKAILEGIEGVEGGTPFSKLNIKRAEDITGKVLKADNELGKLVGASLDDATAAGIRVDAQDIMQSMMDDITVLTQEMPDLLKDKNFNATMGKILKRNYIKASPREIKAAMDDISNSIERISASKYPTPELEQAPQFLKKVRRELDQRLKDTVPQYADAAERFYQFRRAYMEQPISGQYSPDLDEIMYGDLKKAQKKLVTSYEDLVRRTTADSQDIEATEGAFSNLLKATKDFEKQELQRLQSGKIQQPVMPGAEQFMKDIKSFSDDASVRRATRKTQESQGGLPIISKDVAGFAQTGRGAGLTAAYLAGRASQTKLVKNTAKMGRAIYNAPVETLQGLSTKLEANPATSMYGKALREGLQNGDAAKKNAAIFTIMQNPNARALIEADDIEDENEM